MNKLAGGLGYLVSIGFATFMARVHGNWYWWVILAVMLALYFAHLYRTRPREGGDHDAGDGQIRPGAHGHS